jgi:Tfp pilus assembly protein PilF
MQLVDIYARQQEWTLAREMLTYAETLPERYHRYSHTRLRLAKLETEQSDPEQAITILEKAIARDSAFIPTRLYLASLYLSANQFQKAKAQYLSVLELKPNQSEALEALMELENQ